MEHKAYMKTRRVAVEYGGKIIRIRQVPQMVEVMGKPFVLWMIDGYETALPQGITPRWLDKRKGLGHGKWIYSAVPPKEEDLLAQGFVLCVDDHEQLEMFMR